ncbi:MAG: Holliday junction resolvase RuvX [Actinomycetota bacterium]
MESRSKKVLGIDFGARRIGVAIADLGAPVAVPLEVIDRTTTTALERVLQLVRDNDVATVVVGHPRMLSGDEGAAVEESRAFAEQLSAAGVDVKEHDERLTTVMAERGLRDAGVKSARRKELRDAAAAQIILQSYLDEQR